MLYSLFHSTEIERTNSAIENFNNKFPHLSPFFPLFHSPATFASKRTSRLHIGQFTIHAKWAQSDFKRNAKTYTKNKCRKISHCPPNPRFLISDLKMTNEVSFRCGAICFPLLIIANLTMYQLLLQIQ